MEDTTEDNVATPIQTIGTIKRITQGMYSLSKPANRDTLASQIDMNASEVGKTLTDLTCLGIVAPCEKRGTYCLTEEGREFAILLGHEKEQRSQELLADLILGRPEWRPIVEFLRTRIDEPFDISEVVILAEKKHDQSWSEGRRRKAETSYRTILEFAGLVSVVGDDLISNKEKLLSEESDDESLSEPLHHKPRTTTLTPSTEEESTGSRSRPRFEMPGMFILEIHPSAKAIDFFRNQLSEESLLLPWLETLAEMIAGSSREKDE